MNYIIFKLHLLIIKPGNHNISECDFREIAPPKQWFFQNVLSYKETGSTVYYRVGIKK